MVIVGGEENFDVVGDWTLEYVECLVGAKIESYFNKKRGTEGDGVATEEGKREYDEDDDADNSGMDEEKVNNVVQFTFKRCYIDRR